LGGEIYACINYGVRLVFTSRDEAKRSDPTMSEEDFDQYYRRVLDETGEWVSGRAATDRFVPAADASNFVNLVLD
jgi:hypothetical protein